MTAFAEFPEDQPTRVPEANLAPAGPRFIVVPDLAGFRELRIRAESFDDVQKARISCTNRMLRGGVDPSLFVDQLAKVEEAEKTARLEMVRSYRRVVPAGVQEWQRSMFGIGEHLFARLLGSLGHPRIATPYHWEGSGSSRTLVADDAYERTVRQLWAYCGHGDPARTKRRGMTAEEAFALGSPHCKMLVHLLAVATMKCRIEPSCEAEANARSADPASSPHQSTVEPEAMSCPAGGDLSPDESIDEPEAIRIAARRDLSPHQPKTPAEANEGPAGGGISPDESIHQSEANVYPARRDLSADQPSDVTEARARPADRHYRAVYDQRRATTVDRIHTDECVRCGPSGKPAKPGSPWSKGHQLADALRIVGKEILRDLWAVS